jgi:hypothetical protein
MQGPRPARSGREVSMFSRKSQCLDGGPFHRRGTICLNFDQNARQAGSSRRLSKKAGLSMVQMVQDVPAPFHPGRAYGPYVR